MKKIGILGGMSWPSTIEYYRIINQRFNSELGGTHSASIILYSFDFNSIEKLQRTEEWDKLANFLAANAKQHLAGADFLVIATNTMHKVADQIEEQTGKKVLHIGDVTAAAIKGKKLSKVGLLGTRFTMKENFYKERIAQHGIEVAVPGIVDVSRVNSIIYDELVNGVISDDARRVLLEVIKTMVDEQGCEGIILGCTELPLLFSENEKTCCGVPLFDTTRIHATAAADYALMQSI